jgi:flavin-dependent dehydrogenase
VPSSWGACDRLVGRTVRPQALVVGGGPAGSLTALLLARAGVRVRLVDREPFPRSKLCGDTLNPGALSLLRALGVAPAIEAAAGRIAGMVVTGPGGARVAGDYGAGLYGVAVSRRVLDSLLLDVARRAGVDVETGVRVTGAIWDSDRVSGVRTAGVSGKGTIRAEIVVAADGRHSRLAFDLGLSAFASRPQRWAYGATYACVDGLTNFGEMHIRTAGYLGIAPMPDGTANVCAVREWHRGAAPLRADVLARAIEDDVWLHDRFRTAERVSRMMILGPLAVDCRAAGVPGMLLAGDAAGFVDPMTGDGLRFAIRGAELAAEAAIRELATGRPSWGRLTTERQREFGGKWRMNRALRRLVASPVGVRIAAMAATGWGAPLAALIPLAGDVPLARRIEAEIAET